MPTVASFRDHLPGISPGIYSAGDFQAISVIADAEAGIVLTEATALLVFSLLAPLVRHSGCATFESYVMRIREDEAERRRAIAALLSHHAICSQKHCVRPRDP
jgi:chemotaxis protein methyltransferase CheR